MTCSHSGVSGACRVMASLAFSSSSSVPASSTSAGSDVHVQIVDHDLGHEHRGPPHDRAIAPRRGCRPSCDAEGACARNARLTEPHSQHSALSRFSGRFACSAPLTYSAAWYDELTAIPRSHGLDLGAPAPEDQELIAAVSSSRSARDVHSRLRRKTGSN
jgi:hypothetical protein